MRIYTRGGDQGQTSLIYGRRIRKDDPKVEAYGNVDEANSCIGLAVAALPEGERFEDLRRMCRRIQRDLFDVGRDLATPEDKRDTFYVTDDDVTLLESMIDTLDKDNPPLTQFILPGGHAAGATFHFARTVTRRAERSLVTLQDTQHGAPVASKYLNRLSDFLFVAARTVNFRTATPEDTVDFAGVKPDPWGGATEL
ncbi:cob(I)yrinic acid a,c-diamide adenosyltransferase [Alicyclobacillus ferrooxydans]|uniref:Corrinoid adenosyltransferase n=1 Tax=Alicyclobacillus ferrooxydans TaxID=471514 RepID=A0A0P9CL00_9BACL|nr:cob(I)yrinic acid a,c-diamide adenosyltransferase [Alicyclobacillus ferrooxydans]KPV43684.1 hypothetical protein AN477_10955 [Alicyclobacillus ferrooxydans]